jgi:hypothetical protein
VAIGKGRGKGGRKLSYTTKVQFNGNLLVGKAYTAMLDLQPGDEFEIKLGRKQIKLIPPARRKRRTPQRLRDRLLSVCATPARPVAPWKQGVAALDASSERCALRPRLLRRTPAARGGFLLASARGLQPGNRIGNRLIEPAVLPVELAMGSTRAFDQAVAGMHGLAGEPLQRCSSREITLDGDRGQVCIELNIEIHLDGEHPSSRR